MTSAACEYLWWLGVSVRLRIMTRGEVETINELEDQRGVSSSWPHRFDTGFVSTPNPDRDSIIVTRNAPLICR
jgi:hypothetical protein